MRGLIPDVFAMVDNLHAPTNTPEAVRQTTQREWARKHYLRDHMREDALPPNELRVLDQRLARWTADRQREGKLPPDWELHAKSVALAKEFRNNRDEAKPIFTVEEQRDVDASRAASNLRDRIDGDQDYGLALRQVCVDYAVSNALGEFDARRRVTDRFDELYGRPVSDYAKEQRRERPREAESTEMRVLPADLGWEKYEPAFQRWAAYNSMQYVAKRDGAISAKEYAGRQDYLQRWVTDQQRQGKLPSEAEIREKNVNVHELMLPYQKHITRQEKQRMRSDGAYWRRVEDFANEIKGNIDTERRYTRMLRDCAIAGASAHGKSYNQFKGDIEDRFTLRYLYTPAEYYDRRESGDRDPRQQTSGKGADRAGNQERKSRTGKSRDDGDYER
jgi:hypothetical protein